MFGIVSHGSAGSSVAMGFSLEKFGQLRKDVTERLVDGFIGISIQLLGLLPYKTRVRTGGFFSRFLLAAFSDYKTRIESNLEKIHPKLTMSEKSKLVAGVLDNVGRMFTEYYSGDAFHETARSSSITGPGIEELTDAHRSGRPVILASGHIGNPEAGRAALIGLLREWVAERRLCDSPERRETIEQGWLIGGVYRPASNRYFEQRHSRAFKEIGPPALTKTTIGMRTLVSYLRSGGWVMMLHDQHHSGGLNVPFLGLEAPTSLSITKLALRHNALLVPYFCLREPNGIDFRVIVEEPIEHSTEDAMIKELTASLERMVNVYPEQWFWIHRRWG